MSSPGAMVAFLASTDLEASRSFFRDALGLSLTDGSPHADSYDVNGTELRVTLVGEKVIAPYTVLGWEVTDLDGAVSRLREAGVTFNRYDGLGQDDHDAWSAPDGTRVAWFHDPDGNVLSFHQHA